MKSEKPLANKILLFVYPAMEFLLLIGVGLLAYFFYLEQFLSSFIVTCLFEIYILWRFIDRTRKFVRWISGGDEETPDTEPPGKEKQDQDPSSSS